MHREEQRKDARSDGARRARLPTKEGNQAKLRQVEEMACRPLRLHQPWAVVFPEIHRSGDWLLQPEIRIIGPKHVLVLLISVNQIVKF